MKILVRFRQRVEKNLVTRINRSLRGRGSFNIKVGQEVFPEEIIGSSDVSIGFRTINLSSLLGVSPQEIKKNLKKTLGQRVYKGELLAAKARWFLGDKKYVVSPTDGILDNINEENGEVRLTLFPKKVNLAAGVYGIIEKIDKVSGQAIIRTMVDRIYGIFGVGRPKEGFLFQLTKRDAILTRSEILPNYEDYILIGGSLVDKDAISSAISAGVKGIISGGINSDNYKSMVGRIIFPRKMENDIGINVVITEGFGSIPMEENIYKTLVEHEGKFAVIDGNNSTISLPSFASSSMIRIRNTKLPEEPLSTSYPSIDEPRESVELSVGLPVRVIGNAFIGEMGKVVAIDQAETLMPSGIRAIMVTISTNRRKIQIPSTNLEGI